MPPIKILLTYALTLAVFLVIDLAWLGVLAKDFYQRQLAAHFAERVNWPAAILFYLLFVAGVMIFVILPAVDHQSLAYAAGFGVLFGLVTYGTYDLTNLATVRNWPLKMVIVDLCWGMFLTGAVAAAGYMIARQVS
jgi:uncharacterized membrane protein